MLLCPLQFNQLALVYGTVDGGAVKVYTRAKIADVELQVVFKNGHPDTPAVSNGHFFKLNGFAILHKTENTV